MMHKEPKIFFNKLNKARLKRTDSQKWRGHVLCNLIEHIHAKEEDYSAVNTGRFFCGGDEGRWLIGNNKETRGQTPKQQIIIPR